LKIDQLGLGWRSHLLACGFGGEIVESDDCIVVRSPSNPTYYWGLTRGDLNVNTP
jgi:hypothetical protein